MGLGERRTVSLIVDSPGSQSVGTISGVVRLIELSCSASSACTTSAKEMNDSRRLSAAVVEWEEGSSPELPVDSSSVWPLLWEWEWAS